MLFIQLSPVATLKHSLLMLLEPCLILVRAEISRILLILLSIFIPNCWESVLNSLLILKAMKWRNVTEFSLLWLLLLLLCLLSLNAILLGNSFSLLFLTCLFLFDICSLLCFIYLFIYLYLYYYLFFLQLTVKSCVT